MGRWNTTRRTFSQLALCLVFCLPPFLAQALDLSLSSMRITGGADYVIKGNSPADKLYTGALVCYKDKLESLPAETTLRTTLLRNIGSVNEDVLIQTDRFTSNQWIADGATPGRYFIPLETGTFPRITYSHFAMPQTGPGTTDLTTDSYLLEFEVSSKVSETTLKNNTAYSSEFDYTVFSGSLSYEKVTHNIFSLTPGTLAMCSGDTYLSAISGDWDQKWWDVHFAQSGLCTNSSTNRDGYSTDLRIVKDVAMATDPSLVGQRWSIKEQSPSNLSLTNIRIECSGSPPKTITLNTSLQSSAVQPDYEIASYAKEVTPAWLEDAGGQLYYVVLSQDYQLPNSGPTIDDLQSGLHNFVSTINALGDTTSTNNQKTTNASYIVYSGSLYFNNVETTFSSIAFGSVLSCWDGSNIHLKIESLVGGWSDVFGTEPLNASGLCADTLNNPDGFSRDLKLFSGTVELGNISGAISGLPMEFSSTTLDATGGSFSSAALTLPEDISIHNESGGMIDPLGGPSITFSGDTFIETMADLTLIVPAAPYMHSYGLPFYIKSDAFRFALGGSIGMELVNPYPVYVHAEAVAALSPEDSRTSFPSNDILFHSALNAANIVTFDQYGLDGHLDFKTGGLWSLQTSFPKARLSFNNWRLELVNGSISADTHIPGLAIAMRFGQGCHNAECADSLAGSRWYQVGANSVGMTIEGAFGAQFNELGPTLDEILQDTHEDSVAWGDFLVDAPGTYVRNDRGLKGAFMIPGFIMSGTDNDRPSPYRLGQVLLGSYHFKDMSLPTTLLPLHDVNKPDATLGDGMFAGINLGPEVYTTLSQGVGQLLGRETRIRFFDADSPNPQIPMKDLDAVKYVLRPGGLTGVFNTAFDSNSQGPISIYDYDINFHRFAFRQDRNVLDGETFIDGALTLSGGPVANGADGSQQDFEVGFSNLDLTCNGNLGSGQVNTEPEPEWPACDGATSDDDFLVDEGCQTLVYWNMPVLLTAMAFENVPGSATESSCPTEDRQLRLHTFNQIDGLGQPLTMSALYSPEGMLGHQELFGDVQTWFDKPREGTKPGFGLRLRTAYLNQVGITLPKWNGFAVLAGYTDVPLFDDTRLAGFFDNIDEEQREKFQLNIFEDQTDGDGNFDGVPDSYTGDDPDSFRAYLTTDVKAAPKPYFEYSWPTDTMINLNYRATFNPASGVEMPWFQGIKEEADILGVIGVSSVPDFINPEKTKFSFGVSADVAELQNFQLDLGNFTGSLDSFLGTLGIETFSMEEVLCYTPSGGTQICLHSLEENMLNLTGGDLTSLMGTAVDDLLQQNPLASAIRLAAEGLSQIHQAPAQIKGLLMEPLEDAKDDITARITNELSGQFTNLYKNLSAIALYDPTALESLPGAPVADFENMKDQVENIRNQLGNVVNQLHNGISALENGAEALTQVDGIIDELDGIADSTLNALHDLETAIDTGLAPLTSGNFSLNPLLVKVEEARKIVTTVRNAIENVDLGRLGEVLELAAIVSGASIDTSLLDDAQQTINSSLDELDDSISQADQAIQDAYASLPLVGILTEIKSLIDDSDPLNVKGRISDIRLSLANIRARINVQSELVLGQLTGLHSQLDTLFQLIDSNQPSNSLTDWADAMDTSKIILDDFADQFRSIIPGGTLGDTLAIIAPDTDFPTMFEDYLHVLIDSTFTDLLEDSGGAGLENRLQEMVLAITTALPQPSENDIRNMIRTNIVNSPAATQLNTVFYAQFGVLSDLLDSISLQLTSRINELIRQTVDAVNEGLSEQLALSTESIGGWGSALQSVGIDGYALVSQDEFDRIHMDAEFVFDGEPDPTSYNAALDVYSWKADNGKSGCIDPADPNSGDFYDVTLSTHDVSADMLGMEVGIKTAMLGFTIDSAPMPVGLFGNCYLDGEINFETLVLEDLGLEAGIGSLEVYFGATGSGRFEEYRIPKAAFFVGKSCDFAVLERLDPEVAEFIGEISPLYGAYVRGSVQVPIYNGGCAFTLGVGADIGAWFFTQPSPGTYGGLVGGSAYGRLACLAALKGKVQCIGQKSGSEYKFAGDGWAGAGVGSCSPGSWDSVSEVRNDDWCLTGDATYEASYENGWNIDGPNVNCCD